MPLPTFKILTKGQITDSALKELRLKKCIVWPQNNLPVRGRKFIGRRGVSDIIGITPAGLFLAVEVKTVNDFLSDDQINFLNDITRSGGLAYIACQSATGAVELREWVVKEQRL
jgi:hypothetical protein